MAPSALAAFKAAWLWVKAYNLCAKHRFEDALATLRSVERFTDRQPDHWKLFEILQLVLLGRDAEVLSEVEFYVAAMRAKRPLNSNQRFFVAMAKQYGNGAFQRLSLGNWPAVNHLVGERSLPPFLEHDVGGLDIAGVSRRWLRTFRVRDHE